MCDSVFPIFPVVVSSPSKKIQAIEEFSPPVKDIPNFGVVPALPIIGC